MNDSGLRERRRDMTRREIRRAAMDLVLEQGLGEVTVDDIADRAGISPRTFFNYFPSKRAALIPGPEPLAPESVEQFAADRETPVIDGLRILLVDHARRSPDIRQDVSAVHDLLTRYPELLPTLHESIAGFEESLADAVARRLDLAAGDDVPRIAAATCACVLKIAVTSQAPDSTGTLEHEISRAFDALRELLAH